MHGLSLLIIALMTANAALPSQTEVDQAQSATIEKRVELRRDDGGIEYSLGLALDLDLDDESMPGWIEIRPTSAEGAFFLKWDSPSSMRKGNELRVSFGYPYDRESAIPRMTFIEPGDTLAYTFEIDCKGECSELRFVQIDLFMLLDRITWFRDSMASLNGDPYTLVTPVGGEVWSAFYDSLIDEVVTFPMAHTIGPADVPTNPDAAGHLDEDRLRQ
jgi:hypothetical protein